MANDSQDPKQDPKHFNVTKPGGYYIGADGKAHDAHGNVIADAAEDTPSKYDSMSKDELQAAADRRKLTVTGTGKDGNILVGDLRAALEQSDAQ